MSGLGASSTPRAAPPAPAWAVRLLQDIVDWVEQLRRGPQPLSIYTIAAGLPDATKFRGSQIAVSDESGGFVTAFSDGTNWRRVTDRAICS